MKTIILEEQPIKSGKLEQLLKWPMCASIPIKTVGIRNYVIHTAESETMCRRQCGMNKTGGPAVS